MYSVRIAKFAVTLLLFTIALAAQAHAQNNKQIISGTFYEDRATNAANSTLLFLTFLQSPANKYLNITNVSCRIFTGSQQVLEDVTLFVGTTSGNDDLGRDYSVRGNVSPQTLTNASFYSIVTNQIYYKMGPGRFPTVRIDAGVATNIQVIIEASCVLVGNLTDN
ncbi:hypothetical protein [Bradyrhizobium manausense]|uniref:hypothetical protein n=1 Tax=Bradyrhizobium manausense TaxID=989370 RepID=UPI001BA79117|nr:hypothetical protein [Bradyrhizobium manausense]MBR0720709.1 hypothetical protein [Bradyrhizobium manausense]